METTTTKIEAGTAEFNAALAAAQGGIFRDAKVMVCDRHENDGVVLSGVGARRHAWLAVKVDRDGFAYVGSGKTKQYIARAIVTDFGTIKLYKFVVDWKFSPKTA